MQQYLAPPQPFELNMTGRPRCIPQIQVTETMRMYLAAIAGAVEMEVQNSAAKPGASAARLAGFRVLSQNGYNNPYFAELVALAIDWLEYIMFGTAPGQINQLNDQIIQREVTNVVVAWLSFQILQQRIPGVLQMLDQATQGQVAMAANHMNTMMTTIANFQQQRRNQMMGGMPGGFQGQQMMGGVMPMGGGLMQTHQDPRMSGANLGFVNNPMSPQMTGLSLSGPTFHNNTGMASTLKPATSVGVHTTAPTTEPGNTMENNLLAARGVKQVVFFNAEKTTPATTAVPAVKPSNDFELIQQLKENGSYLEYLEKGFRPMVFNAHVSAAFYYRKTGEPVFCTVLVKKEDANVEYVDHENELLLKPTTDAMRKSDPRMLAVEEAYKKAQNAKKIEQLIAELDKDQAVVQLDESVLSTEAIELDGLVVVPDGAYHRAVRELLALHSIQIDMDSAPIAFTAIRFNPDIYMKGEPAYDKCMALKSSTTWLQLKDRFLELQEVVPMYFWENLHRDVVLHINELLQVDMMQTFAITSFVDDINDVLDRLSETSGALEIFNDRCLKKLLLTTLNADTVDLYKSTELYDEDAEVKLGAYAQFATVEDILLLPVTSHDLGYACVATLGIVTPTAMPELKAVIQYRSKHKHRATRHMKMITRDAQTLWTFVQDDSGIAMLSNSADLSE